MKDKDFQQLVDHEFAQLEWTDAQRMDTLRKMNKEERPVMKRKFQIALVFTLILLTLSGTALAAGLTIASIQDFFSLRDELALRDLAAPSSFTVNQKEVRRPNNQRHTSEIVDFTVKEVYWTNKAVYVFGIMTPKDPNAVLIPTASDAEQNNQNVELLKEVKKQKGTPVYTIAALDSLSMPGVIAPECRWLYNYTRRLEDGSIAVMSSFPVEDIGFTYSFKAKSTLKSTFVIQNARNKIIEYNTIYFDIPRLEMQDHGDYPYGVLPEYKHLLESGTPVEPR